MDTPRARTTTHTVPLPHLHGATVVVALRGGPRHETPHEAGLTHFLEHMVFRGAGERDHAELFAAFEDVGEEPDAYTSDDALVLSLDVDPARLEDALALLEQVLLRPRFDDLEHEREVILEELYEHQDDSAQITDDVARSLAFPNHPLGRSILGSEEAIRGYGLDELRHMWGRVVRDQNLVVVGAGPIEPGRLERAVARWRLPAGPRLEPAPLVLPPDPPRRAPRSGFVSFEGAQTSLRFTFTGPGVTDPAFPALRVLFDVLDGGPTSRVPLRLVDSGLAYYGRAELSTFPEVSLVELDLSLSTAKVPDAVGEVLRMVEQVGEGIEPDELARAANRRRHRTRRELDDADQQAQWYARRLLAGLPTARAAEAAQAEAVTRTAVETLAREMFRPQRLCAVMVGDPNRRQRAAARRTLNGWSPAWA
jgi:predicted Zn-dependent peptidase